MNSDFKSFYEQFTAQLDQARQANNPKDFQQLLDVVEPKWHKDEQALFVAFCIKKAGVYALFGESLGIDDWMQKAVQFSEPTQRVGCYFQWINLYWSLAKAVSDQAKLQAVFSSLFNISTQALRMDIGKYDSYALQSVRAFSLAALGKHNDLKNYLNNLKWKAVPTILIKDKTKLVYFYAHIYKLLVAAIEIRDEEILKRIFHLITIDDALLLSDAPMFRKFNTVVMDIADMRMEFAHDFNAFYQLRKKWAGFLPNFSLFTLMIEEENIKGLDLFFKGLK